MSTIVCMKEAGALILGTDSRFMKHDYSGIDNDTSQKIFEVAPNTFIAPSGRKMAVEFQVERARALVAELGTDDIRIIGAALERDSIPLLAKVVERLGTEPDETNQQTVSGAVLLHGTVLAGRSRGQVGYYGSEFRVQDGSVNCTTEFYDGAPRKVRATTGSSPEVFSEVISRFAFNLSNWTDPMEDAALRLLEALKESTPTIGGPFQMVRIDGEGSRWIMSPPAIEASVADLATATISAAISMTAPTITVSGSGWTINLDSTNGFKLTKGITTLQVTGAASVLQIIDAGGDYLTASASGMSCRSAVSSVQATVSHTNVQVNNLSNGHNCALTEDGFIFVGAGSAYTGSLAAAIAAGKNVQGGIIMN